MHTSQKGLLKIRKKGYFNKLKMKLASLNSTSIYNNKIYLTGIFKIPCKNDIINKKNMFVNIPINLGKGSLFLVKLKDRTHDKNYWKI